MDKGANPSSFILILISKVSATSGDTLLGADGVFDADGVGGCHGSKEEVVRD